MSPEVMHWAYRNGIPAIAVAELHEIMTGGVQYPEHKVNKAQNEAGVQQQIRLDCSVVGVRLWRNNVGACMDANGRAVRYGLANESSRMNKVIKSSDLIGIRPLRVTSDMVGATIGQFCAREVKRAGWLYGGSSREKAQLKFIETVNALGGDAKFSNGDEKWT